MPNAAIAVGAVAMFLPVADMATRLLHLLAHPPGHTVDPPPVAPAADLVDGASLVVTSEEPAAPPSSRRNGAASGLCCWNGA